jgi:hypothetical protein
MPAGTAAAFNVPLECWTLGVFLGGLQIPECGMEPAGFALRRCLDLNLCSWNNYPEPGHYFNPPRNTTEPRATPYLIWNL